MLPPTLILLAAKYATTLAFEYVPSLPTKILTPFAYVKLVAATVVVDKFPANTLPVIPAPPCTCRAPVVVFVAGVPLTITMSLSV